jgi:hypothetical protein
MLAFMRNVTAKALKLRFIILCYYILVVRAQTTAVSRDPRRFFRVTSRHPQLSLLADMARHFPAYYVLTHLILLAGWAASRELHSVEVPGDEDALLEEMSTLDAELQSWRHGM